MAFVVSDKFCAVASQWRETGDFSNGRIILDDGSTFKIHKILLATGSGYFETLFSWHKDQQDFHLKEVTKDAMDQILSWMYSHRLTLREDNLPDVLKTAHYLDCFEVVEQCKNFLMKELCFENVLGFWTFAAIYQIHDLEEELVRYVAYHFRQVQKTEEFLEMTTENLQTVLERNDINADEKTVFQSLMNWINYEKDSRQGYLPNLLQCVRLGCVGTDFFKVNVQQNPLIKDGCKGNKSLDMLIQSVAAYLTTPTMKRPHFARPRSTEDAILVIGGGRNGDLCNSIESFDFRANKWCDSTLKDPLGPREWLGAAVIGSKIYLVGGEGDGGEGEEGAVVDLATGEKKNIAPMSVARVFMSMVSLKGCLYAVGGFDGHIKHKTIEKYDPAQNQWSVIAEMKQRRSDAGCTVVGEFICVAGGTDGRNKLSSVEVYNTTTEEWLQGIPDMSKGRSGLSCATLNGELYVLGGCDGVGRLSSCEKYNFTTNQWTMLANMESPRSNFATCVFDTKILAFGGLTEGDDATNQVEAYDESEDRWTKCKEMVNGRSGHAAVVVSGRHLEREVLRSLQYQG